MTKVLLLCRFQKSPNDPVFQEIEESLNIRSLVESDFDKDKERSLLMSGKDAYDYAPILLDLKDISTGNFVDSDHTSLRMYYNANYTVKMPFDAYVDMYSNLMGIVISDFTQIDFNKPNDELNDKQSQFSKNDKTSQH